MPQYFTSGCSRPRAHYHTADWFDFQNASVQYFLLKGLGELHGMMQRCSESIIIINPSANQDVPRPCVNAMSLPMCSRSTPFFATCTLNDRLRDEKHTCTDESLCDVTSTFACTAGRPRPERVLVKSGVSRRSCTHRLPSPPRSRDDVVNRLLRIRKRHSFLNSPHVCPEPVLEKLPTISFFQYRMAQKSGVF